MLFVAGAARQGNGEEEGSAMPDMTLIIGNRNYSSWSLRAWLAMRMVGLTFEEILIPLDQPETESRIREHSPAGRVPVLHHGDLTVWDSLAICEYAAELAPAAHLWPEDRGARATARSVSAEMHSGFTALRAALPMNIRVDRPGLPIPADLQADIDRICDVWRDCRQNFGAGGPFLFGGFSIVDAVYAPVVARFHTYRVAVDGTVQDYMTAIRSLPAMQEWAAAGAAEPWVLEREEVGEL